MERALPPHEREGFNLFYTREMVKAGFCSSEGMILEEKVFDADKSGTLRCKKSFLEKHVEICKAFGVPQLAGKSKVMDEMRKYINRYYPRFLKKREALEGFPYIDASACIYHLIDNVEPINAHSAGANEAKGSDDYYQVPYLEAMKKVTAKGFEISRRLEELTPKFPEELTPEFSENQQNGCWQLAQAIVADFKATQEPVILQARFPTEVPGHAFYVILRPTPSGGCEIMVVNGGAGAEKHHTFDQTLAPEEYKDPRLGNIHPKVLTLPTQNPDFLTHYLYSVLHLPFEPIKGKNTKETKLKFDAVLANLYLARPGFRKGYLVGKGGHQIKAPSPLKDYPMVHRAQMAGNCTMFNYKQALRVAFNLSIVEFGILEDALLQSADRWITTLTASATPATHSASASAAHPAGAANACSFYSQVNQQVPQVALTHTL